MLMSIFIFVLLAAIFAFTSLAFPVAAILFISLSSLCHINENAGIESPKAKLEFRLVHPDNDSLVRDFLKNHESFAVPEGYEKMEERNGKASINKDADASIYFVEIKSQIDNTRLADAYASESYRGDYIVCGEFDEEGIRLFKEITERNVNRRLAIVLDGKCVSAPLIKQPITEGRFEINGGFSKDEAKRISAALVPE